MYRRLVVGKLLSDKVVFKPIIITTEKERDFITIIGTIYKKCIKILNVYLNIISS